MAGLAISLLLAIGSLTTQAGKPIVAADALLRTAVSGAERTGATTQVRGSTVVITLPRGHAESNATQFNIPTTGSVEAGDVLVASFRIRGASASGKPARVELLFERAQSPWTKSLTHGAQSSTNRSEWRSVQVPFSAAESYRPGEAMVSIRLAFQPQTVELADLQVLNYGKQVSLETLVQRAAAASPIGKKTVKLDFAKTQQTMEGFGGNFCQPRYGSTEPMDAVGRYILANLNVVQARIGLPLNHWTPSPGVYRNDAQARASFLALQEMARRRIPTIASVWEGPQWMLPGPPEQNGRTLPPDRIGDCIEAVTQYLVTARDKYGVHVDYFSFNEPDYGVNFKFTPTQMADFIRRAGPRFEQAGLKTKFVVADTANGSNFAGYARPLLEDRSIAKYLGPLAFHSWDALSAPDEAYRQIGALGLEFKKPVWCLEAGHDPQLWQRRENPWGTWENALRLAMAYERAIRLTRATVMDYWTYQDNYPLVDGKTGKPYAVFHVMKQMEGVFAPGSKVVASPSGTGDLQLLATKGPARRFGALIVNPAGPGEITLQGLPKAAAVRIVTSDASAQAKARSAKTTATGSLKVAVPTRSVVTLVGG